MAILCTCALALVLVPAAEARKGLGQPSVRVQSTALAEVERSKVVRLKVTQRRRGRITVGSNLTRRGTLRFRRAGARRAKLKLTRAGANLVASRIAACTPVRVTASIVSGGTRGRAAGRRAAKRLTADRARCSGPREVAGGGAGALAGVNDFSCRPSAAHPRPVILIHGLGARAENNWSYIAPRVRDAGYCVFALTYGVDPRTELWPYRPGGSIPMDQSSLELAAFVDQVRAATGASHVDFVGYSEGTVMPRHYLERRGGARYVKRSFALAPLWRGTDFHGTSNLGFWTPEARPFREFMAEYCGSCPQFIKDSPYLNDLNADGEAIPGIDHTNLVTRYDEWVTPYTSGIMADGGTNLVLQEVCPFNVSDHQVVAFDPVVVQMILDALDPPNAQPVRC